jgi:hypothetical protein
MKIVLNSRVLIGARHDAAENYVRNWRGSANQVEWRASPSARCVLDIGGAPGLSEIAGRLGPSASSGAGPALHSSAEKDLRSQLGLPAYEGDDSSETEVGGMPPEMR